MLLYRNYTWSWVGDRETSISKKNSQVTSSICKWLNCWIFRQLAHSSQLIQINFVSRRRYVIPHQNMDLYFIFPSSCFRPGMWIHTFQSLFSLRVHLLLRWTELFFTTCLCIFHPLFIIVLISLFSLLLINSCSCRRKRPGYKIWVVFQLCSLLQISLIQTCYILIVSFLKLFSYASR